MFKVKYFANPSTEIYTNADLLGVRYAEDLVIRCAQFMGIGPVGRYLFALYLPSRKLWLSPNENLVEWKQSPSLEFRLRFKPRDVSSLRELDERAFNYYFHQIRHDFLEGEYKSETYGKFWGLIVTDLVRICLEKNIPQDRALDRINEFYPKQYSLKLWISKHLSRTDIEESLNQAWENSRGNAANVRQAFVESLVGKKARSELLPECHVERYEATFNDRIKERKVVLKLDPFNCCLLSIRASHDKNSKWTPIWDSIRDLGFVFVKSKTVEISRKNGIPLHISFSRILALRSFVSLLDGYYRLIENWSFNVCIDISSPTLAHLKSMKCHGPVRSDLAVKKLAKIDNRFGTYLLRQNSVKYDEYKLDLLLAVGKIVSFDIKVTRDEGYQFIGTEEFFASMSDLLNNYLVTSLDRSPGPCLAPSSGDDMSELMLCDTRSDEDRTTHVGPKRPQILWPYELTFENDLESLRGNNGYRVRLAKFKGKTVVVKEARDEADFLLTVNGWLRHNCVYIATLYGVTLNSPLSLVMESLPLGPLDRYLVEQKDIKVIDLVEAVTYVARALCYFENTGLVHGLIRCRNLLVAEHSDRSLKVKLSDPLGKWDATGDLPWISPEVRGRDRDAMTSASDVWAFGTTLWEIFSFGSKPTEANVKTLLQPIACSDNIWRVVQSCWREDVEQRKRPQSIVRDVAQEMNLLYNFRSTSNAYSMPYDLDDEMDNTSRSFFQSFFSFSTLSLTQSSFGYVASLFSGTDSVTETETEIDSDSEQAYLLSNRYPEDERSIISIESCDDCWRIEANQLRIIEGPRGILGRGQFGVVRKAVLTHCGLVPENVAVKRLNDGNKSDVDLRDMWREIEMMKQLDHSNIIGIKGYVAEPQLILVMEYIPMGSLLGYLRAYQNTESIITFTHLIKYAKDVCDAMEYLERIGKVHRDLAARNVLVAGPDQVKISDFGLSRDVDSTQNLYVYQTPNRSLPIRWYAPECLGRNGYFSHKSDVWSFGITLWEMFAFGAEPIYPSDPKEHHDFLLVLKKSIRLDSPEGCPPEVYQLMHSCWNDDPHPRPSFSELRGRIEGLPPML